ncbi:MAG: glycosyltransferase family 39 protein [Armatimonadota bacterium]|nr:glycosyltransferase family 39 protein [Armatimonadota bacterium]
MTIRLVDAPLTPRPVWHRAVWDTRLTAPILLGCLVIVGVLVRAYGLSRGLWFDETYSVFIARAPLAEIPRLLRSYDTHPPFYYVLLHLWMAVAGESELVLRLPSLVAGAVAIALTFLLGRRVGGSMNGLLAALFLAASPYAVAASQEARMYALLTAFALGSTYTLCLALEHPLRRHWILYAALQGLALYTHHFALLVVLAHGAYVLLSVGSRAHARAWLASMVVAALLYLPWLPSLPAQIATVRSWPSIRPPLRPSDIADVFALWSFGGGLFGTATYLHAGAYANVLPETCRLVPLRFTDPSPPSVCLPQPAYPLVALLPILLLLLAGMTHLRTGERRLLLWTWLLPFAAVTVVSLEWNLFQKRYFAFLTPFFAILLAAGVVRVARAVGGMRFPVALAVTLAVPALYVAPALNGLLTTPPTHDWRGAADYLRLQAGPGDVLLFIPAFTRLPFEYYYRRPHTILTVNPQEIVEGGRVVGFRTGDALSVPLQALARHRTRLWVVAAAPIGVEARLALLRQTAGSFRESRHAGFGYLHLFRWDSSLQRDQRP